MKVAIVTPYSFEKQGGVEAFTAILYQGLIQQGINVTLINEDNVGTYSNSIELFWQIGKYANKYKNNFDVIICNGASGAFIKGEHKKIITIYHGDVAGFYMYGMKKTLLNTLTTLPFFILEWLSGRKRTRVCVSQQIDNDLQRFFRFPLNNIINNAIDLSNFPIASISQKNNVRRKLGIPTNKHVLLFNGRHKDRGKGFHKAQEIISKLGDDYVLIVLSQQSRPHIEKNIMYTGKIPRNKVVDYYHASDIFMQPSYFEGSSIALIEAMSCGLPIVCAPSGSAIDILKEDSVLSSYIISLSQANQRVSCIRELTSNKELYSTMSREVRAYAEKHFTIDRMIQEYTTLVLEKEDHESIR